MQVSPSFLRGSSHFSSHETSVGSAERYSIVQGGSPIGLEAFMTRKELLDLKLTRRAFLFLFPPVLFPEFKFIPSIPICHQGAKSLYDQTLDPNVGPLGLPASSASNNQLKSFVLPYRAVVLLCSS